MATKLQVWNKALRHLGEPALASTTPSTYAGYLLDDAWATVPLFVLGSGYWNFAEKIAALITTTGPALGYSYAWTAPADLCRLIAVGSDTAFSTKPDYRYIGGKFSTQVTPAYVHYTSTSYADDTAITGWPIEFAEAVACWLAVTVCEPLTQSVTKLQLSRGRYADALEDARVKDRLASHMAHDDPDQARAAPQARKGR